MKPKNLLFILAFGLLLTSLACGPVITVVVTETPQIACAPPLCPTEQVLFCPDVCPGGCGVICVTPTPAPTSFPASPTAPPTASPTTGPSAPAGWLLYTNPLFGYRFYYPPEATITESGVEGFPTDELPAGKTPGEYIAELQAMYGNTLCVGVRYGAGYINISASANEGFRYAICGRTGVGAGTMTDKSDALLIAGSTYTARGFEFMGEGTPCDSLLCHNETMVLHLPDGTRIEYGAAPVEGVTYADYLATTRPVLVQIVSTFIPGP